MDCPLSNESLAMQLRETFPRLPKSPITDAQRQLIHIAADRLDAFDRAYPAIERLTTGPVGEE